MKCHFCGHESAESNVQQCARCGSELGAAAVDYTEFAELVDDELTNPGRDLLQCPSCAHNNANSADYCAKCGSPLAVVTRVYKIDAQEAQERVDWLVYGVETELAGRETDVQRLEQFLGHVVRQSTSAICLLTGTHGIGKSRLVREFNSELDTKFGGALLVTGRCRESDNLPFAPIARLIRKRFYIPEVEIPRLARQRLLDAVVSLLGGANATEIAHLVGYLVGLPFPDSNSYSDADADAPPSDRIEERAFLALARLLETDAQRNPLVFVVEDADHASDETLKLIRRIASQLRTSPIAFVLLATPQFATAHPELLQGSFHAEHIELAPLADEDIRNLLNDILQRLELVPEALQDLVCQRALGNPMIVEEIVRLLIGEGVIDTRPNPWLLHLDRLSDVTLPSEFSDVIRARLDTLADVERNCLELAAVVGQTFWLETIVAMMRANAQHQDAEPWQLDTQAARLADLLESLRRKDMIRPHPDSLFKGASEFVFKHAVERDLIYEQIDPERRQQLHRRCAQWYELHARIDRFAATMARHWHLGGQQSMAAYRFVQAGNQARSRYFNRKAIECYELAASLLPEDDVLSAIELHHNLGSTYELVGEVERALGEYELLLRLSWRLNAKAKGGMALNKIGRIHRSTGQLAEALATFRRALTLFQQSNDLRGIASTLDDIGKVAYIRGEYDSAFKHYRAALELRRQLKDLRSIALSLHHIGGLKLSQGLFKEALTFYRESLEMRKQAGDRQGLADTLNHLGIVCAERGEMQQALRLWEEALSNAQEIGYRALEGVLLNHIGETALNMGALKTAETSLHSAAEISQECGDLQLLCEVQRNLGALFLKNAKSTEAIAALTASLHIARSMESKLLEGMALKALGELFAQTLYDDEGGNPTTKAEEHFKRAIELLTEVGNESELGRCHSAFGNFLLEQGDTVRGKQHLERAREIFSRLEMKRVLKKTVQTIDEI
ncbi:MAG: tetratricopeptide repeat protein [Myxococcota bacterium]|jgi:tetratricopeptide (TPR) repeat protein/ribosomal protein L37E|nr:tetratricopeptide repeat protein [Myxococcota bacterium]